MKLYSKIVATALTAVSLSSCLKDTPNTDFSGIQPVVEISTSFLNKTPNAPTAGLAYFSSATVSTADTLPVDGTFTINLAAKTPMTHDITVTYGVNDAARTAYNAANPSGTQYDQMPDSVFDFPTTSGVIHAGYNLDSVGITFFPKKMDPTKNYMLPISVTDAQGVTISGNFNTIYFHTIGNPIAGAYTWDFMRWSVPSNVGPPDGNSFYGRGTNFVPDDPNTIEVASGYFNGPHYVLHFDNDAGVLSNFTASFSAATLQNLTDNGITIANGPNVEVADPDNGIYQLQFTTLTRYVIDKYYK